MLQIERKAENLRVKDGRIVCPNCKQKTNQAIYPNTEARNLPLWCRSCKAVSVVNISDGVCALV